ncbi:MAG TPA: PQQ-dependent sugar dehydrogenase [Chthoniobacteraceae bacterium]|jgi:glucose/arabinose dehydrogenase|nr:PQQ-dependent sugar dehydrogenase [Chthoniobacteraceae bacterium]
MRLTLFFLLALITQAGAQQFSRQDATVHFPKTLPSVAAYTTEDAFGRDIRFREPVAVVSPPGEKDRFFVVEKHGTIEVVTRHGSVYDKKLFMDLNAILATKNEGRLLTDSEMGLLGIAFHPNYARNGLFYITYSLGEQEKGQLVMFDRLSRFTVSKNDPDAVDPDSELPMITQVDRADNHNGGDLHFGPDGYLYYSVGDEGNQYDHYDNARHIDGGFFAAIFRLDVDGRPGSLMPNPHKQDSITFPDAVNPRGYRVPPDNPFIHATMHNAEPVNAATLRTETWACGLRNPWRFCFDPQGGRMFIGDVGQDKWEEVDIGKAGGNYGWSYYEGTHEGPHFRDIPKQNGDELIPPIYEYPHGDGSVFNGVAIIGGLVYRGTRLPELDGAYIFGDFGTRRIWALQQVGFKWVPTLLNTFGGVASFGVDPANGDILACDLGGNIGRLIRVQTPPEPPPSVLSRTGAFANVATLEPAKGMVPYEPIQPGWNGAAATQRWFGIPNGQKMIFSTQANWEFPTGTVWVQQFNMGARKVETRFLVKTEDGAYGLSYKWRADQTDADLVPEAGQTDADWHYPARAECAMCHSAVAGYAIGFNTWQLNRPAPWNPQVNQVQALLDSGYVEDRHRDRDPRRPAFAALNDPSQPLETRVRSYLAVNCISCHQPGGLGLGVWDARPTTPLADAKIVDAQLVANFGYAANRFVAPGDPLHSMLLRRLKGAGAPKMPLTGVPDIDTAAVAVITQWIASLHPVTAAPAAR